MAKWLGLGGTMLGLLGSQVLFQGIVGAALLLRSRRVARQSSLILQAPVVAE
jgi:hypothetical protein